MLNLQADVAERAGAYRKLAGRNRIVAVLRIAVPAIGTLVLVALLVQIYVSSLGNRFGIGQISVTRDSVTVEAPEYAGLLEDGSTYRVWATSAQAAIDATDLITLNDAALTLVRTSGTTMQANAVSALLDSNEQRVIISGISHIEDSSGTTGILEQTVFDWSAQTLDATGPVHIDYADGTTVDSVGMFHDAKALVWTFSNATVILPSTPGAAPEEAPKP